MTHPTPTLRIRVERYTAPDKLGREQPWFRGLVEDEFGRAIAEGQPQPSEELARSEAEELRRRLLGR